MPRKIKDATLDTRAARLRLKARDRLYMRQLDRGLALGYRRTASAGTWWARYYLGAGKYVVEAIGTADDLSDADGVDILDFFQAQDKARGRRAERATATLAKPLTVKQAVDDYVEFLAGHRKTALDCRKRAEAHILPALGAIECAALTTEQIHKWHLGLAKQRPRLRTRRGEKQKHRPLGTDAEAVRRRKASANRTLTYLKAALNRAWRNGKVASDTAWRRVEPFENVDAARVHYLQVAEAQRLINAADQDFRNLVQAALLTGCRYGELARLQCHDLDPDNGTVAIRESKSGKSRYVPLTDEGRAFFARLVAGRAGTEPMLPRADGGTWQPSHQIRRMRETCERASIDPPINFHALRHTYASLAVMNGTPLLVVAKTLGHSDTRMVEKHYGHLAPSYIADAIRRGAPRFGLEEDNVAPFVSKRG